MRKRLTLCAVAAALIGIFLVGVVNLSRPPGIRIGKPLPPGKVRPQLASGWSYGVLLAPDGSLWACGKIGSGDVALFPGLAVAQRPHRIGSDMDWIQISSSSMSTLALKDDGSLWIWAPTNSNPAGRPSRTNLFGAPTRIGSDTNWSQISAGFGQYLALKIDGSLWAWGRNNEGQLGDGTISNQSTPVMIGAERDWSAIAADSECSFALKTNGTIWGWGKIFWGTHLVPKQIDPGTNWSSLSHGVHTLMGLKTDGTLWLRSDSDFVTGLAFNRAPTGDLGQIGSDKDWAEVHAGFNSFFARKQDGSWWVWGANYTHQLGLTNKVNVMSTPQRVQYQFDPWAFAPGVNTTYLLGKDGKLWTWGGRPGFEQPGTARKMLDGLIAPFVRAFAGSRSLTKSGIDETPQLLWELPAEVRRSLGTGPKNITNNFTN
jgi:alpha-tubulin suppressor-like RCC1 family protein